MKKILLLLSLFVLSSSIANAELVGYWNFNEGTGLVANDSSTYGNNGVLDPVGTAWVTGKYGSAIDFSGSDGTNAGDVVIPDSDSLDITDPYTIMAWVKPDTADLTRRVILSKYSTALGDSFYLTQTLQSPDSYQFQDTRNNILFNSTVELGVWAHIAVTYDGYFLKFYYNGKLDVYRLISANLPVSNTELIIGGRDDADFRYDGVIDEVRIYNNALTPTEIAVAMNIEGLGGIGQAPLADAGVDVIANVDADVMLDASNSSDLDGTILYYQWERLPDNEVVCFGTTPICNTKSIGRAEDKIELKIWDNDGNLATDTVLILNSRVNLAPPEIAAIGNKNVYVGNTLEFQVEATDPEGFHLVYSANNLPEGATINEETGIFSWTPVPPQAGEFLVTFNAFDGYFTDSREVMILAKKKPKPPLAYDLAPVK